MSNRNKLVRLFVLLLAVILLMSGCTASASGKNKKNKATPTVVPEVTATPGPMDAAQELADYIFEHGELPENYIRQKDAEAQGWKTTYR